MERLTLLANALEYIENNLSKELGSTDISNACYCSKSTIDKLFRCISDISVHDYITRRCMMKAARMLCDSPDITVLDVALEFGYGSNESFTRAFKSVWNCTPSEFRKKRSFSELFPRYLNPLLIGDDYMKNKKNIDISELYDFFSSRKDCYFVCCDIKDMIGLNEIAYKAGDLGIIEAMNRMIDVAGDEDVVFRIGADEFVMLTNSTSKYYAMEKAKQILAKNGETYTFENQQIPLTLYAIVTQLADKTVQYNELYCELHDAINKGKGL